jgi:hypothetical protein
LPSSMFLRHHRSRSGPYGEFRFVVDCLTRLGCQSWLVKLQSQQIEY